MFTDQWADESPGLLLLPCPVCGGPTISGAVCCANRVVPEPKPPRVVVSTRTTCRVIDMLVSLGAPVRYTVLAEKMGWCNKYAGDVLSFMSTGRSGVVRTKLGHYTYVKPEPVEDDE